MILTLDIQKKAEPIIRQTSKGWSADKSGIPNNIGEDISDLILTVEGFDNHIFALSKPAIKDMLDDTNKVISVFNGIDENLSTASRKNDNEIIERFHNALKALYKLKSLLHIAYTKDTTVGKTPDHIREGLSAISRAAVLRPQ